MQLRLEAEGAQNDRPKDKLLLGGWINMDFVRIGEKPEWTANNERLKFFMKIFILSFKLEADRNIV